MRQVVYVDVLIAVNLLVDYMLLLAVSKVTGGSIKRINIMLAALVGGAFSCTILLPEMSLPLRLSVSLLQEAVMILIAFGARRRRRFVKAFLLMLLMTWLYGGIMFALWYFVPPNGMLIANGVVYLDVSPLTLIGATVFCYCALSLLSVITKNARPPDARCTVTVETELGSASFEGIVDTGNFLTEPFSGFPVILCCKRLESITPGEVKRRVIPYSSVGGEGVLMGFRPLRTEIVSGKNKVVTDRVYVASGEGFSGGDYEVIVNPAVMNE